MPRKKSASGAVTRRRVLECACAIFADKGYRDTTIAEICRQAKANIAAVNYHFGDKETLYGEALQYAFGVANERYPIDGCGWQAEMVPFLSFWVAPEPVLLALGGVRSLAGHRQVPRPHALRSQLLSMRSFIL